jgi:capsular polysaccharide biosynthesis protein
MMHDDCQALKTRLIELEQAIAETEKRLPAHSVKPPVMHDLLALEDERDALLEKLEKLQHNGLERTC